MAQVPTFLRPAANTASFDANPQISAPSFLGGSGTQSLTDTPAPSFLTESNPALEAPQVKPDKPEWGWGRWALAFTPIVGGVLDIYDMVRDEQSLWEQMRDHTGLTFLRMGANFLDFMPLWGIRGAISTTRMLAKTGIMSAGETIKELSKYIAFGGLRYRSPQEIKKLAAMRNSLINESALKQLVAPGGSDIAKILNAPMATKRQAAKFGERTKHLSPEELDEMLANPFWLKHPDGETQHIRFWMADGQESRAVIRKEGEKSYSITLELKNGDEIYSGGLHANERNAKEFIAALPFSKTAREWISNPTHKLAVGIEASENSIHEPAFDVLKKVRQERKARMGRGQILAPVETLGGRGVPGGGLISDETTGSMSGDMLELLFRVVRESKEEISIRDEAIIEVWLSMGMRVSEISNLRWSNVFLSTDPNAVVGGTVRFKKAKRGGWATEPLNPYAARALEAYHSWRPTLLGRVSQKKLNNLDRAPLFLSRDGKKLTSKEMQAIVQKYVDRANKLWNKEEGALLGYKFKTHDFRRTLARMAGQLGATDKEIKLLLRHEVSTSTGKYLERGKTPAMYRAQAEAEVGAMSHRNIVEAIDEAMDDLDPTRLQELLEMSRLDLLASPESRMAFRSASDVLTRGGNHVSKADRLAPHGGYNAEALARQEDDFARAAMDKIRLEPRKHNPKKYKGWYGPLWYTESEIGDLWTAIKGTKFGPYRKTTRADLKAMPKSERDRFNLRFEMFNLSKKRDLALFSMFYDSGIRSSDVLSISPGKRAKWYKGGAQIGDVDFDTGMITVMGKGGKERIVPLSPRTMGLLEDYVDSTKGYYGGGGERNLFLTHEVIGKEGKAWGKNIRQDFWRDRLAMYGHTGDIPGLGGMNNFEGAGAGIRNAINEKGLVARGAVDTRTLRHSFATHFRERAAQAGMSDEEILETLAQILGHDLKKRTLTTKDYAHRTAAWAKARQEEAIARHQVFEKYGRGLWDEVDKYIDYSGYGSDAMKKIAERIFIPERYFILKKLVRAQVLANRNVPPEKIPFPQLLGLKAGPRIKPLNPTVKEELARVRRLDIEAENRKLKIANRGLDPLEDATLARRPDDWRPHTRRAVDLDPEMVESANRVFIRAIDKVWPSAARLVRRSIIGMRHHTLSWQRDIANLDGPLGDIVEMHRGDSLRLKGGGKAVYKSPDGVADEFMGSPYTMDYLDGWADRWLRSMQEVGVAGEELDAVSKSLRELEGQLKQQLGGARPRDIRYQVPKGKYQSIEQLQANIKRLRLDEKAAQKNYQTARNQVPVGDGTRELYGATPYRREILKQERRNAEVEDFLGTLEEAEEFFQEGIIDRILIRGPGATEKAGQRLARPRQIEIDGSAKWDIDGWLADEGLDDAWEIVVYMQKDPIIRRFKPDYGMETKRLDRLATGDDLPSREARNLNVGGRRYLKLLVEHDEAYEGASRRLVGNHLHRAYARAIHRGTSVDFEMRFMRAQKIAADKGRKQPKVWHEGVETLNPDGEFGHQHFLDQLGFILPQAESKFTGKEWQILKEFTLPALQEKYGIFSFGEGAYREFRAARMRAWGHKVPDQIPDAATRGINPSVAENLDGQVSDWVRNLKKHGYSDKQVNAYLDKVQTLKIDLKYYSPEGPVAELYDHHGQILKWIGPRALSSAKRAAKKRAKRFGVGVPFSREEHMRLGAKLARGPAAENLPEGANAIQGQYAHTGRYTPRGDPLGNYEEHTRRLVSSSNARLYDELGAFEEGGKYYQFQTLIPSGKALDEVIEEASRRTDELVSRDSSLYGVRFQDEFDSVADDMGYVQRVEISADEAANLASRRGEGKRFSIPGLVGATGRMPKSDFPEAFTSAPDLLRGAFAPPRSAGTKQVDYRNPEWTNDGVIPGRGNVWGQPYIRNEFGELVRYYDRSINPATGRVHTIDSFLGEKVKMFDEYEASFIGGVEVGATFDGGVKRMLRPVIPDRAIEIGKLTHRANKTGLEEIFINLPQYRNMKIKPLYWTRQSSRQYQRKIQENMQANEVQDIVPQRAHFEYAETTNDPIMGDNLARGWENIGERQGIKGGVFSMFDPKKEGGWLDTFSKYHYARIRAQHTEKGFEILRPKAAAAAKAGDMQKAAAVQAMMAILGGKGHKTWMRDAAFIAAAVDSMPAVMRGIRGTYQAVQGDKYKFTSTDKLLVKWTTTVSSGLYRGLLFGRLPTAVAQFGQFINNMAQFGAINTARGIGVMTKESFKAPGRKAAAETLFGGGERGAAGVLPSWIGMAAGGVVGSMFFGPVGIAVAASLIPASRAIKQAVRTTLPEEVAMRIGISSSSQLVRGKEFTKSTFRLMQMLDETGFSMLDMAETVLRGATFMTALDVSYRQGFRHLALIERAIRGVDLTQFTYDQLSRNPFWRHSLVGSVMAPLSSYPLKQAGFIRKMLTEDASDGAPGSVALMRYLFFNGLIASTLREGSKAAFGEELVLRDLQGRIEPAIFTDLLGASAGVKAPEGFATIVSFSPGRTPGPQVVRTFVDWVKGDAENAEWLNLFVKSFVPFGLVVSDLYRFDSRMEENAIRREEGFWTQTTKKGSVGGLVRYTTPVREYGRLFGFVSPRESEEMDQERRAKDFADSYANTRVVQEFERIIRNTDLTDEERSNALEELGESEAGKRKIAMGGIRAAELQRYGYSRLRRVFVGMPTPLKTAILAGARGHPLARETALSMGMTSLEWDSWLKVLERLMREEATRRVF